MTPGHSPTDSDICYSYNWTTGWVPNRVEVNPFTGREVCLDACLADQVLRLWAWGIRTYASCCGHGREGMTPNIVIAAEFPSSK